MEDTLKSVGVTDDALPGNDKLQIEFGVALMRVVCSLSS
jgi:hypothetical protein